MRPTAGRLLELLSLLQSRGEWSGPELSERLAVTGRTIRRDVDRLRSLGYTIESTTGTAGGYRLGHGTGIPPLLLSAEEAVAVAVALRSSALAGLESIEGAAIEALLKLELSLPAPLRHRVAAIQHAVLTIDGAGPAVDMDVLVAAATATRDQLRIRAEYTTHHGTHLQRVLEPHRIVRVTDRWYLIAWDLDASAWRTLRLDRLIPRLPLGPRFTPRSLDDAEVLTAVSDGVTSRPYRWRARLIAQASAAQVGEVVGPTRSRVTPIDDTTTQIDGGGDDLTAMALWILSLPFTVIVHQPPELVPHLRRIAANASTLANDMAQVAVAPEPATATTDPGR